MDQSLRSAIEKLSENAKLHFHFQNDLHSDSRVGSHKMLRMVHGRRPAAVDARAHTALRRADLVGFGGAGV